MAKRKRADLEEKSQALYQWRYNLQFATAEDITREISTLYDADHADRFTRDCGDHKAESQMKGKCKTLYRAYPFFL